MIIYLFEMLFVLLAGALLYSKKISKKTFLIFAFFIMGLLLGLRSDSVGEDTAHYIDVFEKSSQISWKMIFTSGTDVVYDTIWNVDRSMEVGYMALNKFVRMFTSNAQCLLIIVSFATCWLMAKFIYDNCPTVFLPTYIFLCESLYMQSFNLMRQMLAIAIGLQSYTILKSNVKHRYKKTVLAIAAAFLFHKSAIVLLLIIPLWLIKNDKGALKYVIAGCIISPFLITVLSKVVVLIVPRYASYFTNNYWESNVGGVIVLWAIEIVICLYIYAKYKNQDGQAIFVTTACTMFYIALEIIGIRITAFTRITLYFRAFLMFLFPSFAYYLKPRLRTPYKVGLIILLSILFLRYAGTPARIYQFFWQ